MRSRILILLLFVFNAVYSQSGFFGAHNGLELRVSTLPQYHNSFRLTDDRNQVKINHKYGTLKYTLNYSRIISRHAEVGFGYTYNTISANSGESFIRLVQTVVFEGEQMNYYTNFQAIEDIRAPFHHFNYHFRFYRSGSLAPIGKYIGLSLNVGMTKLKDGTPVYVGGRDVAVSKNFTSSLAEVMFLDTLYSHEIKYKYFQINGTIGRSYIISRILSFNCSFTLPLLMLNRINDRWKFPVPFLGDIKYILNKEEYIHDGATDPNFYGLFVSPIRRYINVSFDLGIRIHF